MTHESQLTRLGLFDARVPRYTSYPTAPHFGTGVAPKQFSEWIQAVPAGSTISLYLHVPFCRRLCWFCACRTQGTSSDEPVRAYAQTLKAEIAILKRNLAPGITLSRLHWGGGTPTLLTPDLMRDLADTIWRQGQQFLHGIGDPGPGLVRQPIKDIGIQAADTPRADHVCNPFGQFIALFAADNLLDFQVKILHAD